MEWLLWWSGSCDGVIVLMEWLLWWSDGVIVVMEFLQVQTVGLSAFYLSWVNFWRELYLSRSSNILQKTTLTQTYSMHTKQVTLQALHWHVLLTSRGGFRHGRPGQPPGAALFHKTWGAAGALKKKNHLGREAVFYYLSYHCVWNWQIGAPCSCRHLCSLRRCRGQILSEKGEGEGRGGQFTSMEP